MSRLRYPGFRSTGYLIYLAYIVVHFLSTRTGHLGKCLRPRYRMEVAASVQSRYCQSSSMQLEGHWNIACFCTVHMANPARTRTAVNVRPKLRDASVPNTTIYKYTKKFRATASILDSKKKLGSNSVRKRILRIMCTGPQKIPSYSTQCYLHDITVEVWCAIRATWFIGLVSFETRNSLKYFTNILTPFSLFSDLQ